MKSNFLSRVKQFFRSFVCAVLFSSVCYGQPTWTPTGPASIGPFFSITASAVQRVNCAMYHWNGSSSSACLTMAVVWDDYTGSGNFSYLGVYDNTTGNYVQTALPNGAVHPDVVIGEEMSQFPYNPSPTQQCIGVVYELSGAVYFAQFRVSNLGANPLSVAWMGGPVQVSGTGLANDPHIDLMADYQNPPDFFNPWSSFKVNAYHKYVIAWTEKPTSGASQLFGTVWDLASITSSYTPVYIDDATLSDVACSYEINGGTENAYFVYYDPSGSGALKAVTWDINGSVGSPTTLESPLTVNACPRIEGFPVYDNTSSDFAWHAVAQVNTGTATDEVHSYMQDNSTLTINNYSAISASITNLEHYSPAVSSGARSTITSSAINREYVIGWFIQDPGGGTNYGMDALEMERQIAANNCINGGFDVVNSGAITPGSITTGSNKPAFAVSGSNSGYGLMTAWYDGTSVNFKESGNTFAFRPTRVTHVQNARNVVVYPNPVTDILHVISEYEGKYSVTDLMGRVITEGVLLKSGTTINMQGFANGVFLLNIRSKEISKSIKIYKD